MALHRVFQAQLAESRSALNIAVGIDKLLFLTHPAAAFLGMADSRETVGAFLKILGTLNGSFFDQSGRISRA